MTLCNATPTTFEGQRTWKSRPTKVTRISGLRFFRKLLFVCLIACLYEGRKEEIPSFRDVASKQRTGIKDALIYLSL